MNAWTLLIVNILFRWDERHDRRLLIGQRLLDAIQGRWL